MNFYAKIENEEFKGFYLPQIHEQMFETVIDEDTGSKIMRPLFEHIVIPQDEHNKLINSGKEIIYHNGKLNAYGRVDKILQLGMNELLEEGEIVQDNEVIKIEKPDSKYLKYGWNNESKIWEVISTREELMLERKNLIIEYKQIKEEIGVLEEFSDEFESTETIQLLKEKQTNIKNAINELGTLIQSL